MIRHVLRGHAALHRQDGSVEWRSELLENALMNQGEMDVLNVYLLQQSHKTKYLALLATTLGADPVDTDTIDTLGTFESKAPGVDGYSRQQMLAADWNAPTLYGEDYRSVAGAAKVFGPISGTSADVSHVLLVTTATGVTSPATLALAYISLGTVATIPVGQSFTFTPVAGAF